MSVLAETNPRRVDILHEYFLPAERVLDFQVACAETIPAAQDLLNVTLRYVEADPVGVMAFAPRPRVAAVMSFNQPATPRADEAARDMTQRLIQAVIYLGGEYEVVLVARSDGLNAADALRRPVRRQAAPRLLLHVAERSPTARSPAPGAARASRRPSARRRQGDRGPPQPDVRRVVMNSAQLESIIERLERLPDPEAREAARALESMVLKQLVASSNAFKGGDSAGA